LAIENNTLLRSGCVFSLAEAGDGNLIPDLTSLANLDSRAIEFALLRAGESNAVLRFTRKCEAFEGQDPNFSRKEDPGTEAIDLKTISEPQRKTLVGIGLRIIRTHSPDDERLGAVNWAVRLLGKLRAKEGVEDIERLAMRTAGPNWETAGDRVGLCLDAVEALAEIGQGSSVRVTAAKLNQDFGWYSTFMRERAAKALCRFRGREATRLLLTALDNEEYLVVAHAARELGLRKAKEARDKLTALSRSKILLVRRVATEALARIEGP
jgi:HEAT repeat protein